ncbi:MAG TPA: glycosyltransferase 87 family protein [Ktedonobacterales bacterium]|nr:glycosyltransferase 87 family protein [Ktedonobacterales bacterium]
MRFRRWLAVLAPRMLRAALFGVPLIALSVFLAWEVPRISAITYRQTDALPIFLGLRALAAGNDPYALSVGAQAFHLATGTSGSVSSNHAAQFSFHYPLPPALLYLPIALFPSLEAAAFVSRTLTVGVYLAALLCLTRRYAPDARPVTMTLLLLWGIAWWPFLSVILPIIQPTGIVVAALAFCLLAAGAGARAAGAGRWFWAGFALFFALLKPQDALPALVVLAVWAALRPEARWRLLAGFAAMAVVPVALSFIWRSDWLTAWASALIALPAHIPAYYQNPVAALAQTFGPAGVLAWALAGALVLAWLALVIWGAWDAHRSEATIAAGRRASISRARDPQWGIAAGCALALALLPRTGGYEIAIGLLPWFYAWQWAGESNQRGQRWLVRGALATLWLACGLLAFSDHGTGSGVAFGVGLVVIFGALMAAAPGLKAERAASAAHLISASRTQS